jgi:hypothetical protein
MAHGDVEFELEASGSVTRPVFGLGGMMRRRWKEPTPSAVQTQAPNTKVSPQLKATVGLKQTGAVEFAM